MTWYDMIRYDILYCLQSEVYTNKCLQITVNNGLHDLLILIVDDSWSRWPSALPLGLNLWMVSDICTLTSVLCCFRLRPTPSAVWVMCTQRSATTPTPWPATNSACCWPGRPSVGSARPGSWATWAPCTRHWETSPTLFSVTSSTWTSQRYKTTSSDLWGSDGRGTFVLPLRRTPTKND